MCVFDVSISDNERVVFEIGDLVRVDEGVFGGVSRPLSFVNLDHKIMDDGLYDRHIELATLIILFHRGDSAHQEVPLVKQDNIDLTDKSMDELEAIHEAVMAAKEAKAIDHQNELIREYQDLKTRMVKAGVVKEDQLPNFKIRGWTRKKPN
ncbi:hypothetical protein X748_13925 [Mesorhizobium sp. LNJC386A00]|nr:hypothetical protein X748_13925 [Mesorhizobium sp. LNJC386A00]